jgi:hypothetical protein
LWLAAVRNLLKSGLKSICPPFIEAPRSLAEMGSKQFSTSCGESLNLSPIPLTLVLL